MSLYARYAALLDGVLDALEAEGALARRTAAQGGGGRAAARCFARRPCDQCGDGAGQGGGDQSARAGRADRAETGSASGRDRGRDRRAGVHQPAPRRRQRGGPSWRRSSPRATLTAARRSARASGSMSNMSRPIRPGRCTWAIAAARWSAMRWPACSKRRAFAVTREYYVNDAGGQVDTLARSAHLRYREALGEDIGEIPEGLYPGRLSDPGRRDARRRIWRSATSRRPKSEWLALFREAHGRGDARPDPRTTSALLGIHHDIFASEAELAGVRRGPSGRWPNLAVQGPGLSRRARAAEEPRRA